MILDKETIRARIDARAFFERSFPDARFNGDGEATVPCLWHEDSTPSLTLYADPGSPHFHCFGCGEHGDIFSLRQKIEGVDFGEALRRFGEEIGESPTPRPEPQKPTAPSPEELEAKITQCQSALGDVTAASLCRQWRLAEADLERWGVGWEVGEERLTFPVRDAAGKAVDIRRRRGSPGKRRVISQPPCGRGGHLFGAQFLGASPELVRVILGGEKDVVIADAHLRDRFRFVSGTLGETTWKPDTMSEPLRGQRAVVFLDADKAGQTGTQKAAQGLVGYASEIRTVSWTEEALAALPEEKREKADIADLILSGHVDLARKLIEEAKPWTPPADEAPPPETDESPKATPKERRLPPPEEYR
ncbi:hypothetical protein LCGC14_2338790, partial [marine sediment metagenome]